ncbi:21476_t:CDS:2, partial [Cetraspora pellucida]
MQSYLDAYYYLEKANKSSKDPSYCSRSEKDEEIEQKAFNRTFQDPSNLSERFIQFIDKCPYNYEMIKSYYVPYKTLVRASSVEYLFAFDEARILVGKKVESKNIEKNSLFYYIRSALIFLSEKAGIFAVFTDIHSNILNFLPTSYLNLSKRIAQHSSKLFAQFYLLATMNMNINFVNFKETMTLKESEDLQHFFQYGRPLWGSLLMPSSDTKGMEPE